MLAAVLSLILVAGKALGVPPASGTQRDQGPIRRGDVVFRHATHFKKGLRCHDCHPGLFNKKRGTTSITMAGMASGQTCGKCHNGKKTFAVTGHCFSCHTDRGLGRRNEHYRGVTFRHTTHTPRTACTSCHPRPFAMRAGATAFRMSDISAGRACGTCHDGVRAFSALDCRRCHSNLDNYGGTVAYRAGVLGAVHFSHRAHVTRAHIDCMKCHPQPFRMRAHGNGITMTTIERGSSCGGCHNGHKAFAAERCSRCHDRVGAFGGLGAEGNVTWKDHGTVTFSHKMHLKGRNCKSCHGKKAVALFPMKAGKTRLRMEDMAAGANCGACHNEHKTFGTGECLKCHVGMHPPADIVYPEEDEGPVTFSHKDHADADVAACGECHDKLFKPKKGANKITMDKIEAGRQCGACHNGKRAFKSNKCDLCHISPKPPKPPSRAPSATPSPRPAPQPTPTH